MGYTLAEELQGLANQYMEAHDGRPAPVRDIAAWAIRNSLWHPQPSDLVSQCAEQIARAMRAEHYIDPQGRRVRAKHAARIEKEGKQTTFWADIRTAPHEHIVIAFRQRRKQVVDDCRNLKLDVGTYNENRKPNTQIPMSFDFTRDLAEIEAAEAA